MKLKVTFSRQPLKQTVCRIAEQRLKRPHLAPFGCQNWDGCVISLGLNFSLKHCLFHSSHNYFGHFLCINPGVTPWMSQRKDFPVCALMLHSRHMGQMVDKTNILSCMFKEFHDDWNTVHQQYNTISIKFGFNYIEPQSQAYMGNPYLFGFQELLQLSAGLVGYIRPFRKISLPVAIKLGS